MSQHSLLDVLSAFKATASAKPVPIFGIPASWICFGQSLDKQCQHRWNNRLVVEVFELAEVSYLYLLTGVGAASKEHPLRLQCPALDFDKQGRFADIWPAFVDTATNAAENVMGKGIRYPNDICITTAWQGETRDYINNMVTG